MGGRHSKKPSAQKRQMTELREAFLMFDKNKDGEISKAELGRVMRFLDFRPTDNELNQMIRAADIDGNGTINFDEFLVMMTKHAQQIDEEEEIRQIFRTFDKRHKGIIYPQDIKAVMAELGEELTQEEIDAMIVEVDPNRSGLIDYKKFEILMKNLMYS
ncbi:unnamed protein product [Phaedon cochleariae]|uniref:EF-hand domain-containing protein n=1 Tax=Phaedon cochleariae TaxID=80249 RepID=A0A9P0GHF4_PHACE|nr:unnamed protein product [Phaedon cochleariae]